MFSLLQLKLLLIDELNQHLPDLPGDAQLNVDIFEYPPDSDMGDLALPCFGLAKKLKQNPNLIAKNLKEKMDEFAAKNHFIKEVKVVGPYLNFILDKEKIAREILTKKPKKSVESVTKKSVVVEYISPNSNKPLHLGHVRNALIGEALSAILKKSNGKILKTCLINDRGIHIIKSMLAYQKFGDNETPQKTKEKGDFFVGKYYILYGQKLTADQNLEKEAYEMLQKWENGDKKTIALWKKMNGWWLSGFKETCQKLGVKFDKIYFESKIYKLGKKLVSKALKNKILTKDEKGNIVANLEKYNMPNKVVLRANGTSVYATNDLILAYQRAKDFPFDKLIYVVASEQDLYFKQLLKIFEILKAPFAKNLKHLSHGLVLLPEGKLKSREGTRVDADDLIKNIETMVSEEIKKRHPSIGKKELESRTSALALAALKYYILQVEPTSNTLFKPEESISLAGKTGVYIEYAYARIQSILSKIKNQKSKIKIIQPSNSMSPVEQELIMYLIKYGETLERAAKNLDPSQIANYLYDLAKKFNDFYEKTPVLKASEPAKTQRILLIKAAAKTLEDGMELLGIKMVNKV